MMCWLRYWLARDGVKLLATVIEAAQQVGLGPVAEHIIAIRSWATITVLVSKEKFTAAQIEQATDFCQHYQFDLVCLPGLTPERANQYHVLYDRNVGTESRERAVYYQAGQELLDPVGRETFYENNLCQVRPATDDRPYFHDFFRWGSLGQLREVLGDNWVPFIDWGYLILVVALGQSVVLGVVFILLGLLVKRVGRGGKGYRLVTLGYFGGLGLAYMMLEMSFIQRLALFLAHPIAAVAVVLTAFLIFSGLGSIFSHRWRNRYKRLTILSVLAICMIGLVFVMGWGKIIAPFAGWSLPGRCLIAVLLLAPLSFFMGMPFPAGLGRLSECAPGLTAWAWGINCFASVVASSAAVCIAISYGHNIVTLSALVLYVLVGIVGGKSLR